MCGKVVGVSTWRPLHDYHIVQVRLRNIDDLQKELHFSPDRET